MFPLCAGSPPPGLGRQAESAVTVRDEPDEREASPRGGPAPEDPVGPFLRPPHVISPLGGSVRPLRGPAEHVLEV